MGLITKESVSNQAFKDRDNLRNKISILCKDQLLILLNRMISLTAKSEKDRQMWDMLSN